MASVEQNEMLLAPEEVLRHAKGAPKSKDELTATDKKHFRRKKKLKQKFMPYKKPVNNEINSKK